MKSGAPFFRIDMIYMIYLAVKYFSVVCVSIYYVKTTLTTVGHFFAKKLNVCPSDIIWNSTALNASIFSIRVLFHRHWRLTGQQGKGGDHLLFHSITFTRSQTFRNLFATLHVRWLSHIFDRTACIYQTATRWELPTYRITIWLIDDMTLVFDCWRDDLILAFLLQQTETVNR